MVRLSNRRGRRKARSSGRWTRRPHSRRRYGDAVERWMPRAPRPITHWALPSFRVGLRDYCAYAQRSSRYRGDVIRASAHRWGVDGRNSTSNPERSSPSPSPVAPAGTNSGVRAGCRPMSVAPGMIREGDRAARPRLEDPSAMAGESGF